MTQDRHIFLQQYREDLVSERFAHPGPETKEKTVYLCAHGFGASPFEWSEFKNYVETQSNALVSSVILGGHDTLDSFKTSTWQDWAEPIVSEYHKLINLGFKRIILCGCSTGAALLLQLLDQNKFNTTSAIKHCVLIAPLLNFKDKKISLLPFIHYLVPSPKVAVTKEEAPHWIHLRPKKALLQLLKLSQSTKQALKKGISIPKHITAHIIHSKYDPVICVTSSDTVAESLSKKSQIITKKMILDSNLHVPTRLAGRQLIDPVSITQQRLIFDSLLKLKDV